MNKIGLILDWVWNLRILEGRRHKIAQGALIAAGVYPILVKSGIGIPEVSPEILAAITGYFAVKITGFTKAHKSNAKDDKSNNK